MQNFTNLLFDGFELRTLVVIHTEDTKYLTDSIASTAAKHRQKLLVINLESYEFPINDIFRPFDADIVLLLMMGIRHAALFGKWLKNYNYLFSETRMMWLFKDCETYDILGYLEMMRDARSLYNLVILNFNESTEQLLAYRISTFDDNEITINPRDARFRRKKGALFDGLFLRGVYDFQQRPLHVYAEPDVPTVVLFDFKKWVVGSDVSVAVLIGRYLNASVRFTSFFEGGRLEY